MSYDSLWAWNLWWYGIEREWYNIPPLKQKKKKVKKPYTIECRHTGKWSLIFGNHEWHTYSRYKTEKSREQALKDLSKKDKGYIMYRRGKDE